MDEDKRDAQAIIDVVRELAGAETVSIGPKGGEREVIAYPKGVEVRSIKPFLDEYLEQPERMKGTARHTTLSSFCDHVKRFADEHSAIFADDDPRNPRLLAVLDYHAPDAPRWGEHRARYDFPVSEEWQAWTGVRVGLGQRDFGEFLEERIGDVLEPANAGETVKAFAEQLGCTLATPSQLMGLARGLSLRVNAKVTQAMNLSTGEVQVAFEETHQDKDNKGPLKVPGGLAVGIPVFRGGDGYKLPVRLRYRVRNGEITWLLSVHRADRAFTDAFERACDEAAAATGLPLFRGTPES